MGGGISNKLQSTAARLKSSCNFTFYQVIKRQESVNILVGPTNVPFIKRPPPPQSDRFIHGSFGLSAICVSSRESEAQAQENLKVRDGPKAKAINPLTRSRSH